MFSIDDLLRRIPDENLEINVVGESCTYIPSAPWYVDHAHFKGLQKIGQMPVLSVKFEQEEGHNLLIINEE